jgi:excisionase family DNA binding protein
MAGALLGRLAVPATNSSELPRLLRVVEAAALLAISRRHLAALIALGDVNVVRLGRCVRVRRAEVHRLCADAVGREISRRVRGPRLAPQGRAVLREDHDCGVPSPRTPRGVAGRPPTAELRRSAGQSSRSGRFGSTRDV